MVSALHFQNSAFVAYLLLFSFVLAVSWHHCDIVSICDRMPRRRMKVT
jgi:hypothetical protein